MLVVDDEEGIRFSLELIFEDRFRVTTAASGDEALRLSRKAPFALAIVDLRMEGISGIDVLRELKRICPFTEVVILTAYETLESARAAVTLNAFDYLGKPFDVDHLLAVAEGARKRFNFMTLRDDRFRGGGGPPGQNPSPPEPGAAETPYGSLLPARPLGRRMGEVVRLIQSGPVRAIPELARAVDLSPSRLRHEFRERTSVALKDHLLEERLKKAAHLLISTPLRVKEIAFRVGYSYPTNFSRAFKKRFNVTPVTCRRRRQLFSKDHAGCLDLTPMVQKTEK